MAEGAFAANRTGIVGAVSLVIHGWAILGGIVLIAVVMMNVLSVIGGVVWKPFPGDFELTEIGVAVAAFAFLPYCQLTDSNVTADIFTAGASTRVVAAFKLIASIVAFLFGLLLFWRMFAGMLSQREYGYKTAIVSFQIWWAFIPILVSLALLAVASLITVTDTSKVVSSGKSND